MSDQNNTIGEMLAWARDHLRGASATPRLDAELLLAHVLGWGRARVLAEGRQELAEAQRAAFHDLVERRAALEPVAYLVGRKEFYGLEMIVDQRVLVPRPETELLVDLAIAHARSYGERAFSIADIGTGSGGIAVALAVHIPTALVYATDISQDALAVAWQNVALHQVGERVRLVAGDLLDALPTPVDVLVSNPPYTILPEIDEGVRRHEPHLALDGGPDGLDIYRRLLAQAPAKLRTDGLILLEIGATQAAAVVELARRSFGTARINIHKDLAGLDRVVTIGGGR
jgi:release factor glutamine methyltransferase